MPHQGELQQAGDVLLGLSAGLQGRGGQFVQGQRQEERLQEQGQREQEQLRLQQEQQRRETVFTDSQSALNFARQGRFDLVTQLGQSRLESAGQFPDADFSDTEQLTQMAQLAQEGNTEAQENLLATLENNVQIGEGLGILERTAGTAGQREFESLTEAAGLSEDERAEAARISLGLSPRATARTATREGDIAAAKEAGKLSAQLKLAPKVRSAVESSVLEARKVFEDAGEQKSNSTAFRSYETAVNGLTAALADTVTGPIVGFLPAMTSSQQIAKGATAAMAPILKQVFRSAGEGTFTDSDQALLNAMIPTRTDRPEAREAKLKNIDAIVRAKLGQSVTPGAQAPAPAAVQPAPAAAAAPAVTQRLIFNPATGQLE